MSFDWVFVIADVGKWLNPSPLQGGAVQLRGFESHHRLQTTPQLRLQPGLGLKSAQPKPYRPFSSIIGFPLCDHKEISQMKRPTGRNEAKNNDYDRRADQRYPRNYRGRPPPESAYRRLQAEVTKVLTEKKMAQFVFVANGISNEHFETAMEVKIKSGSAVRFVPQGSQGHGAGVNSPGMSSVKSQNGSGPDQLQNVRFEWDLNGAGFGAEIVRVLAGHRHNQEVPREPAA
jgi:hypothetical protein